MQFQADLLGVPVVRPKVLDTTALGAPYLAGLTVNLWKSREENSSHWKLERRFEPTMERAEAQEKNGSLARRYQPLPELGACLEPAT